MGEFRGKGRRCYIQLQPVSPGIWHVVSQRSHPDSPSDSWRITVIACLWSLTSSWSHNYRMASRSINQRHRRCRARAPVSIERLSLSLSLLLPPLPYPCITLFRTPSPPPPPSRFCHPSIVQKNFYSTIKRKKRRKKERGTRSLKSKGKIKQLRKISGRSSN